MSIRLEFEIALSSDYHVGAGYGLGPTVDSALLRDPDNVPVLRGTTINGLLRQGLYDLLQLPPFQAGYQRCEQSGQTPGENVPAYCGQWHTTTEICLICALFGSPARMKRWRISSARPVELQSPQRNRDKWRPGETGAQINTRVRVSPRTRRAAENKLFSQESGDGRLSFRFSAECLAVDASAWEEAEWLVAAARMVRRLGSARRRGRGECEIRLLQVEPALNDAQATLLDRFADRRKGNPPAIAISPLPSVQIETEPVAEASDQPYRLWVWVRLDEPLLVSRRADTGNQFESVQSIPGTVLRGALAWRMAHRLGDTLKEGVGSAYETFVSLFFGDKVHFSPLLPLAISRSDHTQAFAAIPAPKDLVTCELHPGYPNAPQTGHGIWSRAKGDDKEECPRCQASVKSLDQFIVLNDGGLHSDYAPQQSVEMHISMDPKSGRVRESELFGFVTLDPGQYFLSEIVCADKRAWETLRQMSGLQKAGHINTLRMGKASRRGHGQVSVLFAEGQASPWHGSPIDQRVTDYGDVVMTLLSDAIIVDEWGRAAQGFAKEWLAQELGLSVDAIGVTPDRSFSAVRGFQSFNAKLGLPKARDTVLAAGSTVHLHFAGIDPAVLQKALETVEVHGIGLRRNEGFGRVVFNHPVHNGAWPKEFLPVPEALVQANDLESPLQARLRKFAQRWQKKLDGMDPKVFALAQMEVPARLIQVTPGAQAAQVKGRLEALGEQTQLLASPLKGRDKTNFYGPRGDGEQAMKKTYELLAELGVMILQEEGFSEQEKWQLWKIGLEALADAIAGPARKKAQEER